MAYSDNKLKFIVNTLHHPVAELNVIHADLRYRDIYAVFETLEAVLSIPTSSSSLSSPNGQQ